MSFLNKLFKKTSFGKTSESKAKPAAKKIVKVAKEKKAEIKKESAAAKIETKEKKAKLKPDGVLISPLTTEKAVSGQSLNKYVFKVVLKANKIDIIKAVSKVYNVRVIAVNIINITQKARQVGKTKGFKSGYKKAVVTLAKGQSIEAK